MLRKSKNALCILLTLLLTLLTACGSTSTAEKNTNSTGRVGNANYNIANSGWIDEEDGWLYYGLWDGLYKCREDGTSKVKLHDEVGGVYDINVINDWVYFRSDGIYRIKTDGTSYEQIAAEDVRGGVHFVDGKIYNGSEYRMDFDGSEKERIYNKNSACGYTLNIVDGWIYFFDTEIGTEDDKIYKMKYDGSDFQSIYEGRSDHMIVDGEWIYFTDYEDDKSLCKMKTDGSERQVLADTVTVSVLEVDGWIYYVSNGKIHKIKTDGTQDQLMVEDVGAAELQLHKDWLYYKVRDSIYRIRIDGTDKQSFAALGEATSSEESTPEKDASEVTESSINLIHSYETKFGEENAVTYPSFAIKYPSNWMVTEKDVQDFTETMLLVNERGVEIRYYYFANVPRGGGSHTLMKRVEVAKVADSSFVPGSVQATDYSDLGKFCVASLKLTGTLDMRTDSDFTDIDGETCYAVLPESMLGIHDGVTRTYEAEFSFDYAGCISLIAKSPDGQFTPQELQEIIAILSSFEIAK